MRESLFIRPAESPFDLSQRRDAQSGAGLTVEEVARRYRVSPDKVRAWIALGELKAINTAAAKCGRPRFVVLPEHLVEFERNRSAGPPPKPARRRRQQVTVDHYPD